MEQNILVRTLGDTHFLKVLGFLLEHPVHAYTISSIAKYLDISRETVSKDLEFYEALGYIVRTSRRGPYKLKLGNDMVQTLISCTSQIARSLMEDDTASIYESLQIPTVERRGARGQVNCVAGA